MEVGTDITKKSKLTGFRIDEDLRKVADENILIRASIRHERPETFSAYVRNLIKEDHDKNRKILQSIE